MHHFQLPAPSHFVSEHGFEVHMSTFSINTTYPVDVTLLPNVFLDTYMPSANGEFVKIYLYLLRMAGRNADFSLAAVADALSCTEADVRRALRYWERTGLLLISGDPSGEMDGISLCMPEAEKPSKVPVSTEKEPSRAAAKESDIPRSTITARRIDELRESEEIQELLFIAQQYIGHPLNRTELEKILYFYDDLHFPAELIDYLIEYCSNGGHNSIHYIEKVALSWHDEGIRTVEAARQQAKSFNKDYYAIFRALGINNHSPIPAEIRIMDKWLKTYKFPLDVITEACTRTVMSTAKPTLAYADGILSSWYKKGAASLEDISKIDTEHNKARRESRKAKKTPDEPRKGGFYNFEQRNYDYDSLEKQLLSIGSGDGPKPN